MGPHPDPAPGAAPPALRRSRLQRALLAGAGLGCVSLGFVGLIVPGMPATMFFVAAAWCFARSSPRFERWLLDLPAVGNLVRDYRAGLGMPKRAKVVAIAMMWSAIAVSCFTLRGRPGLLAAVVGLGLVGSFVIARRVPTREQVLAARGATAG